MEMQQHLATPDEQCEGKGSKGRRPPERGAATAAPTCQRQAAAALSAGACRLHGRQERAPGSPQGRPRVGNARSCLLAALRPRLGAG